MKQTFCLSTLLLSFFSLWGQAVDTAAVVREVDSLISVSNGLLKKAAYREALDAVEAANRVAETTFGVKHAKYANCQHQIGAVLLEAMQYDKAEDPLKKGLQIRGELFGTDHVAYSTSLNSLGILYARAGRFDDAERIFLQAKSINEKRYGLRHYNYAMGLQNLATVYKDANRFEDAENLYRTALAIFKDTIGEDNSTYGMAAMNMGVCIMAQGRYGEAEKILLKSLQSSEKAHTKKHRYYLLPLQNLAVLYSSTGRYPEALQRIEEAKAISVELWQKDNPSEGELCNTAGLCYKSMRDYANAEREFLQCRDIILKRLGKNHYRYAQILGNLALLYAGQGNYQEAQNAFNEALALHENIGQNNSPGYATLKLGLGKLFVQQGDHASGQSSFLQALEVLDSIKAEKRNEYEESVFELAKSYYRERTVGQATPQFRKLSTLMQESMRQATKYFSEKDLLGMQAAKERERHHLLSYCLTFPDAELQDEGYNLSLTAKLLLMENQLGVRRMLSSANRSTQEEYNRWIGLQRRIAAEYVKPAAGRKNIAFLEAQSDSLERNLARNMADFGNMLRIANWHDVQTALQPDEAAVEFVHFNYYSPASTDSIIYAALLLKSGMKPPLFIPMCTEKQLATLLSGEKGKSEKYHLNDLYGIDPATGNNALYQLLWAPLDAHLSGLRTVYYSSSGLLHRLNLSALHTAAQTTLADQYDLVALGSTRQLAYQARHTTATEPPSALLYGGVQFSMDSTAYPAQAASSADNRRGPAIDQTDAALRGEEYWAFLNGSDKEVDRIQAVLSKAGVPVQAVKGWKATEESFKQIGQARPSPQILHISTHGFFFPDTDVAAGDGQVEHLGEQVVRLSDHPMIRSGLILAGANHAWKTGHPLGNREDGILTAYEISQLDLRHTDLVVLSACKTGLGHIEANEGVYGLQRAFKIAGAKTLVMSLWNAPDNATQEMMAIFYQKLLGEKLPARQALRAAQSEMRRRRYEPYDWAGFVVVE